jgi:hypothetical protein
MIEEYVAANHSSILARGKQGCSSTTFHVLLAMPEGYAIETAARATG